MKYLEKDFVGFKKNISSETDSFLSKPTKFGNIGNVEEFSGQIRYIKKFCENFWLIAN